MLLQKYNVLYTEGNFNNDIGVPKTLLRLNSTHDIAVVEMGASHPGDIKTLVEIVEPTMRSSQTWVVRICRASVRSKA